jgi:hypothetical protein
VAKHVAVGVVGESTVLTLEESSVCVLQQHPYP